jgi:hypothetical protein
MPDNPGLTPPCRTLLLPFEEEIKQHAGYEQAEGKQV